MGTDGLLRRLTCTFSFCGHLLDIDAPGIQKAAMKIWKPNSYLKLRQLDCCS